MTDFRTYWDNDEKERAALSETDVERFIDAELMLKGVLRVKPPELDPEPAIKEPPTTTFYRVSGSDMLFTTSEAAEAARIAKPLHLDSKYLNGRWQDSVKVAMPLTGEVETVQAMTNDTFIAAEADLGRAAAAKSSNRDKREAYEKAAKEQSKALEGLWDDWHRCRNLARQHQNVIETLDAYTRTAGGDETIAARFLGKVFSVEQIKDAAEWFGRKIQTDFTEPKPAPGPSHPDAESPAEVDDIPL